MNLAGHGLRIVERKLQNFLPVNDREYLCVGGERTRSEVAKILAPRRPTARCVWCKTWHSCRSRALSTLLRTPPNFTDKGWGAGLAQLIGAAGLGHRLAQLDMTARRDLLALFGQSAGDLLDSWFESDPIKAVLGFDFIVGTYASPYSPGSAYVLLHHCLGETNGKKGMWGHAIGGMGAITQAMGRACAAKGVEIFTADVVREVIVERGCATGVVTESGRRIGARAVVSNLNPKLLYSRLVDASLLPDDFHERIAHYRCGSGTFRMNVALSELPRFTCLPEQGEHLTAGIIIAPSLRYMDRAYQDARAFGWSRAPIVEMLIPSERSTIRWHQRAATLRACSASTSRRSFQTDAAGTIIAMRLPS